MQAGGSDGECEGLQNRREWQRAASRLGEPGTFAGGGGPECGLARCRRPVQRLKGLQGGGMTGWPHSYPGLHYNEAHMVGGYSWPRILGSK